MRYYSVYFGQAYGEGVYGSGKYSCTTEQQQNGTCNVAAGGSTGLADTGLAIAIIVTLACFIVFVSLVVRIWRRKPQPQEDDSRSSEFQDASSDSEQSN